MINQIRLNFRLKEYLKKVQKLCYQDSGKPFEFLQPFTSKNLISNLFLSTEEKN